MAGNEHGQLRPNTIYAELVHSDGKVAIMATLEYILAAIRNRDLAVEGVSVKKYMSRGSYCSEVFLDRYNSH